MPLSILGLRANKCLRKLCSDESTSESYFKSRIEKSRFTGTLGAKVLEWGKNQTLSPFVNAAAGKIISEDGKIDPNALKSLNDIRKYLLKCLGTKKKGNFYKFFNQEITSENLKGARVRAEAYLKLVKNPQKSNDDSAESTTADDGITEAVKEEMENRTRMKNETAEEKWKKSHLDRLKILFALILIAVYKRYQEQKDTTNNGSANPSSANETDPKDITVVLTNTAKTKFRLN